MNEQELEDNVRQIIADIIEVDPKEITPDAHFVKNLGMDSLKALELVVEMEKKLKIHLGDGDLTKLTSLRKTVEVIQKTMNR
jgi:acyl carrier protein